MNRRLTFLLRLLWVLALLASLGLFFAAMFGYVNDPRVADPAAALAPLALVGTWLNIGLGLSAVLVSLALACLLFWKKANEGMALYLSFFLLLWGVIWSGPLEAFAAYWLPQWPEIGGQLAGLLMPLPLLVLLLIFPNGQFAPRWTICLPPLAVAPLSLLALRPLGAQSIENWLWLLCLYALGIQAYRYRRLYTPLERQQTKWVVYGLGLWIASLVLLGSLDDYVHNQPATAPAPWWSPLQDVSWSLSLNIVPIAFTLAIMRSRLWDIDILINRTLVYASLTALIVAMYVVIVGGLSTLFQTQTNTLSGLVAAAIIAMLFQPLREHLQRRVNRLLYGERDDPAAVLARLAHHPETADTPTAVLPNLVHTIAHTLKIPHVAIWLPVGVEQMEPVAVWGAAPEHVQAIPLIYHKEAIGQLVVAPRGPQERFSQHEQELLATIAALTATTVRAVQLSDELRRSRQRIVTAREDERRRLRRDLHDGLGPQLASQMLGLEAVAQLMPINPEKAQSLLNSLKMQAQDAILDVRRLVYDLRPPALDDLGLIGALRQSASRYETDLLRFSFDIPQTLPELPAAVETAVYRIAQEAMTNVVRHAEATRCTVRLCCTDAHVLVEVRDNGCGLPQNHQSGVGLQAMKERTTELNGQYVLASLPDGGTLVQARLPLEV
jgi:signal transduction histidine kinase